MPKLIVKKLDPKAVIPRYTTLGAAGMDISARTNESITILPNNRGLIKTGISVEIPVGYELQCRSRSGLALKSGVFVLNSPGTIDSDYRGEIGVILFNTTASPFIVNDGDRVAQLVMNKIEYPEIEEKDVLSETERGLDGFGSTGVSNG